MEAIRAMKALLVASIGALGVVVGYDNLVDYDSNWAFVQHVLSMDTVFPDNATRASRAITNPTFQRVAYATIIAAEWAFGLVCLAGAWRLFRARRDRDAFIAAKPLAAGGLTLMFVVYFVGFLLVGGEWLSMWQSTVWNGQAAAARFLTCGMLVLIVLLLPEQEPDA
jgi:predicted small integral membrane protein